MNARKSSGCDALFATTLQSILVSFGREDKRPIGSQLLGFPNQLPHLSRFELCCVCLHLSDP